MHLPTTIVIQMYNYQQIHSIKYNKNLCFIELFVGRCFEYKNTQGTNYVKFYSAV
jgi:hypothetical protein